MVGLHVVITQVKIAYREVIVMQYTLNKNIKDMAAEKREETVSELDSSLNEWFDSIPAHCNYFIFPH